MKLKLIALLAVTNALNFRPFPDALKNNQVYAMSQLAMEVILILCRHY